MYRGLVVALSLVLVTEAKAQEYCVACEGPKATYICSFKEKAAGATDSALQLYCITELAKSGPHASCSIDRGKTTPCKGEARVLEAPPNALDSAKIPLVPTPADKAAATKADAPAASDTPMNEPAPEQSAGTPAEQPAEAQGKTGAEESTLQKAGNAITNTAKKSWKCVTSLFGDC